MPKKQTQKRTPARQRPLSNMEIAAALDMLADMMELDEQNKYKVIAVQTAARRVAETNFSLQEVAARGELTELPGAARSRPRGDEVQLSALIRLRTDKIQRCGERC